MSEGLQILLLISKRGGCLLSELAVELGIPKSSVSTWVPMLCSTGYLKRDKEESDCSRKSGMKCLCCHCSCEDQKNYSDSRIELTQRGIALIRREWDEKNGSQIVSDNGRLSRNNLCAQ